MMINNFRNFIEFSDYVAANGAIFVPESCCGWAKQYHQNMPKIDLNLPTIEKKKQESKYFTIKIIQFLFNSMMDQNFSLATMNLKEYKANHNKEKCYMW